MILDTYKEIEHLKEVGADLELAKAIVELHTKSDEHLVTKADLKAEIDRIESMMKVDRALLLGVFLMLLCIFIKIIIN
jgi:hypothetical protein